MSGRSSSNVGTSDAPPADHASRAPYIGGRSFGRSQLDRQRFFGRDDETDGLSALIIAQPFVVLCADSGAGKSSLCEAGLAPRLLEQDEFDVLPTARVRCKVHPLVRERGGNPYSYCVLAALLPDLDPTELAGLSLQEGLALVPCRRDSAGESMPRLLIIDQAEELFTFYPEGWTELDRRGLILEIAAALRADRGLRVLWVIRDDYVSKLAPFAPLLPGELRAQFHLEGLGRAAARRAIEGPLRHTHRHYAPGVAEQIVAELSKVKIQGASGERTEITGPYVEPVLLQLVCERLWERLAPHVTEITAEHVCELGADVDRALQAFYEDAVHACVSKAGVDEGRVRAWFEHTLLTPMHTRGMVFWDGKLAGDMSAEAIKTLRDQHIIRAESRAGALWYELTHDRLVEPIINSNAPFWVALEKRRELERRVQKQREEADAQRHRREQQRRERNRQLQGACLMMAASILFWMVCWRPLVQPWLDLRGYEERLEALTRHPENANTEFAAIAKDLWTKNATQDLEYLLRKYEQYVPEGYGLERVGAAEAPVPSGAEWAITLEYNSDAKLDQGRVAAEWRSAATSLQQLWGLPVPLQLRILETSELTERQARLTGRPNGSWVDSRQEAAAITFGIPRKPSGGLISEQQLSQELRAVFDGLRPELRPLELSSDGGPWFSAPRWSIPMLKAAGVRVSSFESALARAAANQLLRHPELALSRDAVEKLLVPMSREAPHILKHALSARGGQEGVRTALIALVAAGQAITPLRSVLDALADHPVTEPDPSWIQQVAHAMRGEPIRGLRVRGPDASEAQSEPQSFDKLAAQREEPAIRIYLGAQLVQRITTDGKNIDPVLLREIGDLSHAMFREFGFILPPVKFREADTHGKSLDPTAFRVELFAWTDRDAQAIAEATDPTGAIIAELRNHIRSVPSRWIDTEGVVQLLNDDLVSPELKGWLRSNYSANDLKNLLRSVLQAPHGAVGITGPSLREPAWLLGSLVFWRQEVAESSDIAALALRMQQTQQARTNALAPNSSSTPQHMAAGLAALHTQDFDSADREFGIALREDRGAAVRAFLAAYPEQVAVTRRAQRLLDGCTFPRPDSDKSFAAWIPERQRTYEVDEFLATDSGALDAAQLLKLRLWLLRSYGAASGAQLAEASERATAMVEMILRDQLGERFAVEDGFWLGYGALRAWRESVVPPAALDQVGEVLANSLSMLGESAGTAVWQLLHAYEQPEPRKWFWAQLVQIALTPNLPGAAILELANYLANIEDRDAAWRALEAIERVPNTLSDNPYLQLSRGWALLNLASYENGELQRRDASQARDLAETLLGRSNIGASHTMADVFSLGAEARVMLEDYDGAKQVLAHGIAKLAEIAKHDMTPPPSLARAQFFVELALGDTQAAHAIAQARTQAGVASVDDAFIAALIELLGSTKDYDAAARRFIYHQDEHPYKDYIRLMYFWRLQRDGYAKEAEAILRERYKLARPSLWRSKLAQGDRTAWREMLIGYFLDDVKEADVIGPLASPQKFQQSPLASTGVAFEAFQAEGYFYDALKQQVSGGLEDRGRRYERRLVQVLGTSFRRYYEFQMARYLLSKRGASRAHDSQLRLGS